MDLPGFGKRKSKTLWEFIFFLKNFKSNTYDRIVKENRNKRLKVPKHKHTIFVEKLKIKNYKNTFKDAPISHLLH